MSPAEARTVPRGPACSALRAKASQAYAQQSRELLEHQWIMDHLPLVRHVVGKVSMHVRQDMDSEDLISAGTVGLIKAARAFDPGKDAEFKTYAYIRIRGAVLDELRGRSFVPSAVHAQIKRVQRVYRECLGATGEPPEDEELAAKLGISVQQLYRTLEEARRQQFLSIHGLDDDEPAMGRFLPADDAPSPQQQAERNEMLSRLAQAIKELPRRDRLIVMLYYERDLTMKETAQVLGVTESRVSQLHASALFRLSMKLGETP